MEKPSIKLRMWVLLSVLVTTMLRLSPAYRVMSETHFSWISLALTVIFLCFWLLVLKDMELSLALPLLSMNFMFYPIMDFFLYQVPIRKEYGIGVILILCGVILLENPYAEKGIK